MAGSIRISQALGAGCPKVARRATWAGLGLTLTIVTCLLTSLLLLQVGFRLGGYLPWGCLPGPPHSQSGGTRPMAPLCGPSVAGRCKRFQAAAAPSKLLSMLPRVGCLAFRQQPLA